MIIEKINIPVLGRGNDWMHSDTIINLSSIFTECGFPVVYENKPIKNGLNLLVEGFSSNEQILRKIDYQRNSVEALNACCRNVFELLRKP